MTKQVWAGMGAAAGVMGLVAVGLSGVFSTEENAVAPASMAPTPPAAQPGAGADPAAPPAPSAEVSRPEHAVRAPTFDVVRIEGDGRGLVAGQAPGAGPVQILVDGSVIAQAEADATGRFVGFVTLDPAKGPRRVTLRQDGVISADSVLIAGQPAPHTQTTTQASTQEQTPTQAPTAPPVANAATSAEPPEPAVTLLANARDGVRVLEDLPPDVAQSVVLDAISYDAAGDVALTGRGAAQDVRIYLDNQPITLVPSQPGGRWRAALPQVETGVYTLRIDSVDDTGAVTSRVETPFHREAPATIAKVMGDVTATPEFTVATRTVQPGNTLWAIAQDTYGDGVMYARVFAANADLIRDPDLIYPGQVFRLPAQE